jgi:hypothetical protein
VRIKTIDTREVWLIASCRSKRQQLTFPAVSADTHRFITRSGH